MTEDKLPLEEEQADIEVEFTTREEYIGCCYNAMNAADTYNAITKSDSDRVRRIKRKCLRIIDSLVCEMYDELFDDDDE